MLNTNSLVLDVRCGSGKPVTKYFYEHGHRVIGIDISETQISLAKKHVPKGVFEVRDMSTLREGEYQVDAVVSFYAIFHIPREEHEELFRKFSSYLRDDGLILVTMGSSEWEGNEEFFGVDMHWSHFGHKKNSEIIREAGFDLVLDEIDDTGGEKHQVILGRKVAK